MKKITIDETWLKDQYLKELRSAQDISKELKCSLPVVLRKLKSLNIPLRTVAETTLLQTSNSASSLYRNKDWLADQPIDKVIKTCENLRNIVP
jgi:hypothetical protein